MVSESSTMNRDLMMDDPNIQIELGEEARLSGSSGGSSKNVREVPHSPGGDSHPKTNDGKLKTAPTRSSGSSSSSPKRDLNRSRRGGSSSRDLSPRNSSHDKHRRPRSSERRPSSRNLRSDKQSSSSRHLTSRSSSHDKRSSRSGSLQRRSSHRKSSNAEASTPIQSSSSRRKLKSERDLGFSSPLSISNRSEPTPRRGGGGISADSNRSEPDRRRDRKSSRRSSYRKSSSEAVLSRSPHRRSSRSVVENESCDDRHHDSSRRKSSRLLHEKSSSERKLSRSPHRKSSRRQSSSRKLESSKLSPNGSILEHQEYDTNAASQSWGGSPKRRKSEDADTLYHASISSPPFSASKSLGSAGILYDDDEDIKAKEKGRRRRGSDRVISPGVEHFSTTSSVAASSVAHSVAVSTLYGDDPDADAKIKAKASRGGKASQPGVDRMWRKAKSSRGSVSGATISTGTISSGSTKASRGKSLEGTSNHGEQSIYASSAQGTVNTVGTLYGTEADDKAKARAGRGEMIASNPGVERVHYDESVASTTDTLYGSDADAKARAKASKFSPGYSGRTGSTVAMASLNESARSLNSLGVPFDDEAGDAPVAKRVSIGSTASESSRNEYPERQPRGSNEAMDGFQMPNNPETSPNDDGVDKAGEDEERKKSRKKRCLLWLFFLVLLLGGGAAIWYFLFRNAGSSNGDTTQTKSSDFQDESSAPSPPTDRKIPPIAPPLATTSPSASPSAVPTIGMLYEAPSDLDCDAIAKNETLVGREDMENADFGLKLEVVLANNATMTEPLLQELMDAIQEKILPSLAGCFIVEDKFLEDWRFVIFDAFVKGSYQPEEPCLDEDVAEQNCHRVFSELALFLKGKVSFLNIIRLISNENDNFANHLGLSDQFLVVTMVGARGLTPTSPPTVMPSDRPSVSPSAVPSAKPTPGPTSLPSKSPTMFPTIEDSLSPTLVPSFEPSPMPTTRRPSSNPSLEPTKEPTETPSMQPTVVFSGQPTSRPTMDPSARPTDNPTISPSESPSGSPSTSRPSSTPSSHPTGAPSSRPSAEPTAGPSTRPSASPSAAPSPVPSRAPSKAPVDAIQLITQTWGPYTNYPVSQSTTSSWGGAAIRGIDGNTDGRFWGGSVTHTSNGSNEWWQVDLGTGAGSPVVVDHITIWNRTDNRYGLRLIGATLQLLDASQNDITPSTVTLTETNPQTINFGVVPGVSFVRVNHNSYLSLAEVEVFGFVP